MIINGKELAKQIRSDLKKEVDALRWNYSKTCSNNGRQ